MLLKEKDKRSILRVLAGLAIDNLGLKLLAIVLAFAIYHALKPSDGTSQKTSFERTDEQVGTY